MSKPYYTDMLVGRKQRRALMRAQIKCHQKNGYSFSTNPQNPAAQAVTDALDDLNSVIISSRRDKCGKKVTDLKMLPHDVQPYKIL